MKRDTAKKLGFAAAIAMGIAIAPAAFADGNHGHKPGQAGMAGGGQNGMMGGGQGGMTGGQARMMKMMQMMQKHRQMTGGTDYMPWLGNAANAKDKQAILQAKLAEFDANGDGALSIAEFETLHSAAIRELMVDRFQALDNDGDGLVTAEEMKAPARRSGMMGAMMGGGAGHAPGNGMKMGAGNGAMMQDQDDN
jgi:Ca2+-binding EF-hand superfamily protein